MFNKPIHVGCPNIGNKKLFFQYMEDIFNRKWLTNDGYYLKKLETEISNFIGVKHSIAVCNATVGLEIVIRSLNLKGEVILPSFTFIATAHALSWFNIKPVFCDISENSYNINPSLVEELITNKTSAIMGVHVYGRPCDIDGLNEVSIKYNLPLVFDAAHAFGCKFKNQMIGSFGKCEVFSFHVHTYYPEHNHTKVLFWNWVYQEYVLKTRIKKHNPSSTINGDDTVQNITFSYGGMNRDFSIVTSTKNKYRNHTESLKNAKIFIKPKELAPRVLYK